MVKETKIRTLTLNPAFDLHCSIKDFNLYQECYAETLSVDAGGKGINISRALKVVGTDSLAIVVVGAENAMEFCKALNRDKLNYEEIVGSVAGDDTLLVVCADNDGANAVVEKITEFIR